MQIITASKEIIGQLIDLCTQLTTENYAKDLPLLLNNSIGKHMRHIIEFYDLMIESLESGVLSYDHRNHCEQTESNVNFALERLRRIYSWFDEVDQEQKIKMLFSYDNVNKEEIELPTCLGRELVYNIEHAIHHMAIIRIAIESEFKEIQLHPHFGVAYSTVRYKENKCAR